MATVTEYKTHLKVGDTVQVISGRGSGKRALAEGEEEKKRGVRGEILSINKEKGTATVKGAKIVFKHQRINKQDPNAPKVGRVEKEAPIALSNLMLVCPHCLAATRVKTREEMVERADGRKKVNRVRVCKKCDTDL
jgi:large subunit ribosomal protein L24